MNKTEIKRKIQLINLDLTSCNLYVDELEKALSKVNKKLTNFKDYIKRLDNETTQLIEELETNE